MSKLHTYVSESIEDWIQVHRLLCAGLVALNEGLRKNLPILKRHRMPIIHYKDLLDLIERPEDALKARAELFETYEAAKRASFFGRSML